MRQELHHLRELKDRQIAREARGIVAELRARHDAGNRRQLAAFFGHDLRERFLNQTVVG
jgi:hypothetical protein